MVKVPPRAEIAYRAIREAIIEQALTPGTKLREDEIGAHFQMSRTLVRAALSRLEAEGLVESSPKRSARVAQPTLEEAREIFAMRKVLEREAVRLVVEHWRAEFGASLEGLVREEEAAQAADDQPLSVRLAGEFHLKLAELTGNALLQRYLDEVVSRCSLILATFGRPHSSECGISEHLGIIEALRRADADAAFELMERHLGAVEDRALAGTETGADVGAVLARYSESVAARYGAADVLAARRRR